MLATRHDSAAEDARTADQGTDEATRPATVDDEPGRSPIGQNLRHDILRNERRRRVLWYVERSDGPVTLSEVAEHVAALENGVDPNRLTSDQRKRVYVGLYQTHLPKLDDAGVVAFDKDRGTIEPRDGLAALMPYLDGGVPGRWDGPADARFERLGVAVATALGVSTWGGLVGVFPLSAVPASAWATINAVALLAFTAVRAFAGSGRGGVPGPDGFVSRLRRSQ